MDKKDTFYEDYQSLIESFDQITKDADNPYFKSKYVPLNKILPLVKENCKANNFVFLQQPELVHEKSCLITKFVHLPTEKTISGKIELVHKPEDPQKLGASITYMRRYMLSCMLGLEEVDDDGNFASDRKTPMIGAATGTKIMHLAKILGLTASGLEQQVGKKITELTIKEANSLIKQLEGKLDPNQEKQYKTTPF